MIELLNKDTCISCNLCVQICPTNVFEKVKDSQPAIARIDDCQTCFMCEAYCPVDALYVAPEAEEYTGITQQEVDEKQLVGVYRKQVFKHDFKDSAKYIL